MKKRFLRNIFLLSAFIIIVTATLVSSERIPASADALNTAIHGTSPSSAAVPIVATAVWATVLMARIPAALIHLLNLSIFVSPFVLLVILF